MQAFQADRFQILRDSARDQARRDDIECLHLNQYFGIRRPLKGRTCGQQLIQRRPHSIDIGTERNAVRMLDRLLQRHVTECAGLAAGNGSLRQARFARFGNPKVDNFHLSVTADQNIRWLQIPVNNPLRVDRNHGLGHGMNQFCRLHWRHGNPLQRLDKIHSIDEFEHHRNFTVRFEHLINLHDSRMI